MSSEVRSKTKSQNYLLIRFLPLEANFRPRPHFLFKSRKGKIVTDNGKEAEYLGKGMSRAFKPVHSYIQEDLSSHETLQVLTPPDPEDRTVTGAYAGRLGDVYVSGTQKYIAVDPAKCDWHEYPDEEHYNRFAQYKDENGQLYRTNNRPTFLSEKDAVNAAYGNGKCKQMYLTDEEPKFSGNFFANEHDALEDGRILAALTAPELSHAETAALHAFRPDPIHSISDPQAVRDEYKANDSLIGLQVLRSGKTASLVSAELALAGAVAADNPIFEAVERASKMQFDRTIAQKEAVNLRADLPRNDAGRAEAIAMTGVIRSFSHQGPMTPEMGEGVLRRMETAALTTELPVQNLSRTFASAEMIKDEVTLSRSRETTKAGKAADAR
jgi:hypothetical protein